MNRRGFLSSASVGISLLVGGCTALSLSNSGKETERDFESVQRLGAAGNISVREPLELEHVESSDRTFAELATIEAAAYASTRLLEILQNRSLLGEGVIVGFGEVKLETVETTEAGRPDESEFNRAVDVGPVVGHEHIYSRDGELVSEPSVGFTEVVEATPRSFSLTSTYSDREYDAVLPVLCERRALTEE